MSEIILKNLDDAVITRLREYADQLGLTFDETIRQVLEDAVRPSKEELAEEFRRIRAMSRTRTEPPFAEDLIREDRDGGEDGRYRR